MTEKTKVDTYIEYLDKLLTGKKDIEFVKDAEIHKLLLLAKAIIAADLSVDNKISKNLIKQIRTHSMKKPNLSMIPKNHDELDEEELEFVAAGFTEHTSEEYNICPYCGYRVKKHEGKCHFCGH